MSGERLDVGAKDATMSAKAVQGRDHKSQGRVYERLGHEHECQGRNQKCDHERRGTRKDATIRATDVRP